MRLLFSLAAAAAMAATGASAFAGVRGTEPRFSSPVSRIVALLQDFAKKLAADLKAEQELYDRFTCWKDTTVKSKTASNMAAEERVRELTQYLADIEADNIDFTQERQHLEKEVADLMSGLEEANRIRDEQHNEFLAAEEELTRAVSALGEALGALQAAAPGGGTLAAVRSQVRKVAAFAAATGDSELQRDLGRFLASASAEPKDWEKLNKKADFKMEYKGRTMKLQAVISDLTKQFNDELGEARDREAEQVSAHRDLSIAKEAELVAARTALREVAGENGARGLAKSDAEAEKLALEEQVNADKDFVIQTQAAFQTKKEEFSTRKNLRVQEMSGVSEAISILHNDDSRDNFKLSFNSQGYGQSFLQLSDRSRAQRAQRAAQAARALGSAPSARVQLLALSAKEGEFAEVITAIDEMVTALGDEETDDLNKKTQCEDERVRGSKAAKEHSQGSDDATAFVQRKEQLIADLNTEIGNKTEEKTQLQNELTEARRLRDDEHAEFLAAKLEDQEASDTLNHAVAVLSRFYSENDLVDLAQVGENASPFAVEAGSAPPVPPPTWDTAGYRGSNNEHTGIVAMLEMLERDVQKDMADAQTAEDFALSSFGKMEGDTTIAVGAIDAAIGIAQGEVGLAGGDISSKKGERTGLREALKGEMELLASIRPGCDFIQVNFESRKQQRILEKESLINAKAILQGAGD